MEKDIDKLVRNLYLCSSTSREKMQQSLIENILYSLDEPLTFQDIEDFIKSEFHIEIDTFELKETLERLTTENEISFKDQKYFLNDTRKKVVLKTVLENKKLDSQRQEKVILLLKDIDPTLSPEQREKIGSKFHEYIYECFFEYGRNAINYFLPFKQSQLNNGHILTDLMSQMEDERSKQAFSSLIRDYHNYLDEGDLDYFEGLAIKAEYFFSLGIPESTFNKSQDLKLNGLVVLTDTNFFFSILDLHSHKQNNSCNEIVKLVSSKTIDCRLVFIKKTLEELKNTGKDFEKFISRDNLTHNQISALVDSEELNAMAKQYFKRKLKDPEEVHPADKISHSASIFSSKKIELFNYKFPDLDNEAYINSKFTEYYDYLNIVNSARVESGLPEKLAKVDRKLEHDIYLREAVISLRKGKNNLNEINYICLTLDRGLINFDKYVNHKTKGHSDLVAPNFMLPSIFLRKIRPFIPIITKDYKKAFISSITANTLENGGSNSEVVQRTMSYFKKLGIDDEDLIIKIIKQELFFKKFLESEKEDKQEEFLQAEVDKAYARIKEDKDKLEDILRKNEEEAASKIAQEKEAKTSLEAKLGIEISSREQAELALKQEKRDKEENQAELQSKILSEKIQRIKSVIDQKEESLSDLKNQLGYLSSEVHKKVKRQKVYYLVAMLIYYLGLVALTVFFGWEKMEPVIYFLGFGGAVIFYFIQTYLSKNLSPLKFFKHQEEKVRTKIYGKANFDATKIDQLESDLMKLRSELQDIQTTNN